VTSVTAFIAAVDKFMSLDKRLVGADEIMSWQPGREPDTYFLKLPLEVDGEQMGQSLFVKAYPLHPTQRFSIGIIFEPTICRLDFWLEGIHSNGLTATSEGLSALINGSHYHPWEINKGCVESPNKLFKLQKAVPFTDARQFDSALRWFCGENKILLPPKHTIELPLRTRLI